MNSHDKLYLTDRLPKQGSIEASTPMMLEMVAVGAMATQFELRMPSTLIFSRKLVQSNFPGKTLAHAPQNCPHEPVWERCATFPFWLPIKNSLGPGATA